MEFFYSPLPNLVATTTQYFSEANSLYLILCKVNLWGLGLCLKSFGLNTFKNVQCNVDSQKRSILLYWMRNNISKEVVVKILIQDLTDQNTMLYNMGCLSSKKFFIDFCLHLCMWQFPLYYYWFIKPHVCYSNTLHVLKVCCKFLKYQIRKYSLYFTYAFLKNTYLVKKNHFNVYL